MRLIDADELLKHFDGWNMDIYTSEVRAIINCQPTVEQKHGHWIKIENENLNNAYVCSECGHMVYSIPEELYVRFKGCYCGAKMRGDDDGNQ